MMMVMVVVDMSILTLEMPWHDHSVNIETHQSHHYKLNMSDIGTDCNVYNIAARDQCHSRCKSC